MAEPTRKAENTLAHINEISSYITSRPQKLYKELEAHKKRLDEALHLLREKRAAIAAEMEAEEARERERERLALEKEAAIKQAASEPILAVEEKPAPQETKKAEQPAAAAKKAEEISATPETPVAAKEESPAPEVAVKAPEAAVEPAKTETPAAKPASTAQDKKAAIIGTIFEKPKKQVIEKPVIRIYVPPEEPQRTRRPAPGAPGSTPYQGTGAPRSGGVNAASRPSLGGRPSMTPPPPAPSTAKQPSKKKTTTDKPAFDTKRTMDRKTLLKKGYIMSDGAFEYDELSGDVKKVRSRKPGDKRKNMFMLSSAVVIEHAIINKENVTIKELSEKIGKTGAEIIKQLFLLGIIKTINDTIDFDTAELVAGELGVELELQHIETVEEKVMAYHEEEEDDAALLVSRPPIVTIMGHVDHGKTSILDYIRKANVAGGEAGGITQHIGAYSITVNGSKITFLDTPGHAAFTAMRARGANATDIAIIVVAADDGVMPQTVEAINHAKAAGVTIIVALNKMDKTGADADRTYSQLSEHGLLPEEWGGDVPVVKMSAKTGEGVDTLLENILTVSEIMDLKANPQRKAKGTIVEARLDKGKGPVATVLVQNGTLQIADFIVAGSVTGKVRAMHDSAGRAVTKAEPSMAVSILGLQDVPAAGDQIMVVESEKMMRQVADERLAREKQKSVHISKVTLDDVFKGIAEGKLKNLNLIIKADVQGSVEAIRDSLVKLSNDEVKVNIVHAVAGAINESDVTLADTTGAIIIGFNVRPDTNAKALAERQSIDIRLYRVIYDAIDDVTQAIKGLLAPKFREQYLGKAEVRELFKISSIGTIAGCMVKDGKIVRNAKVRLIRDNIVVADTQISSLKRMKDDAKEVLSGFECGIGLQDFNDIKVGDIIESFNIVQEAQ